MSDALPLTPWQRRRSLAAVIASAALAGMTYGYLIPLLALILERQGYSQAEIGINAASGPIATIIMSLLLPAIFARFGILKAMLVGAVIELICVLLMPLLPGLWEWFALRLIMGFFGAILWIGGETWIIAASSPQQRGRAIALYMMALSAGFACGPLAIEQIGIDGWMPFIFAAIVFLLALIVLASAWGLVPLLPAHQKGSTFGAVIKAPLVMAAALLGGFVDNAFLSHLAIFTERAGLATSLAVAMLSVMMLSNLALQLPIGWIAERVNRRGLLIVFGVIFFLAPLALLFGIADPFIRWPAVGFLGAASLGIYTVALYVLGDRFSPAELAGANAAIVAVYQIGSIIGPPIGGWGMDHFGNPGLMYVGSGAAALFLIFAAYRTWVRRKEAQKANRPG